MSYDFSQIVSNLITKSIIIDPIESKNYIFLFSSGSTTATSNEDVLNNASDSNSQDAEMSSPLHNHENNHSDNNVRSGNNGNSTEQTPEVTDETSNGPLKVCFISIDVFILPIFSQLARKFKKVQAKKNS